MVAAPLARVMADVVGGDEQVVEAAFTVGGQEWLFDAGGDRRLGSQLPVRNGLGGEVDDVDRHESGGGQRLEVLAARMDIAGVPRVDRADRLRPAAGYIVVAAGDARIPAAITQ